MAKLEKKKRKDMTAVERSIASREMAIARMNENIKRIRQDADEAITGIQGRIKEFHISDVLSVTTGRLVSSRHMEGIYEVLNFMTADSLFTHQLPRAMRECEPWLKAQYPKLMADSPEMQVLIRKLQRAIEKAPQNKEAMGKVCAKWVMAIQEKFKLPEMLPIEALSADMHTKINPIEEAEAMVGNNKVIAVTI